MPFPYSLFLRLFLIWLPLADMSSASGVPGSVTLAWNANPETNLSGYRLVYGKSSTELDQSLVVGTVTTTALGGLEGGMTYYCAVQAFNTSSLYSELSPPISFVVPEVLQPVIAVRQDSSGIALTSGVRVALPLGGGTESFTVRNAGSANLTGLRVGMDGPNAEEFQPSSPLVTTLAPGESTIINVQFRPTNTGSRTATFHLSGDGLASFDIVLSGEGIPVPEIAVEQPLGYDLVSGRATIHFSESNIGETSSAEIFTIRNTGTGVLTGLSLRASGTATADFPFSQPELTTLQPGTATTFLVSFRPSVPGIRTATLHLVSNDTDESPFIIQLEGNGPSVPEISVSLEDSTSLTDAAATVGFGNVTLGDISDVRTLTITNSGEANITGLAITADGIHIGDFTVGNPADTFLPPGASTTFRIYFQPDAAGTRTASIHIGSNDADENPFDIALSGVGITSPEIAIARTDNTELVGGEASISFGNINLGSTSSVETLTIRNTGTAPLTGLAVFITGSLAPDFTVTAPASTTLAPGATTTFGISFRPSAAGIRTASLTLASNDADENPFHINLTGTGVAVPEIAVTRADNTNLVDGSSAVAFGSINLGSAAAPVTLTIRNVGTAPLTGIAVSSAGNHVADFALVAPSATTLAPGASTTFSVAFRPTASGIRGAVIRIASNDADENPFDINLSGNGVAIPVIALEDGAGTPLAPGSAVLSFPDILVGEATGMKTVVVKNTGTAPLTGLRASLSGSHGDNFTLSTPAVTILAPGASTILQVSFSPQDSGGKTASLLISSSATPAAPLVLGLTGNAITAPEIAIYQGSDGLASDSGVSGFGNINLGSSSASKVFTIRNLGSAPLSGLKLRSWNTEFIFGSPAATTLAPGSSTTFKVAFKPDTEGTRTGVIALASNDADENPFLIHVTGTGIAAPQIAVTGNTGKNLTNGNSYLNFGSVTVEEKSTSQTVTIRNAGTATLMNLAIARSGNHATDFTITSLGTRSLAPGASTKIRITFKPTRASSRWAAIRITSNDSDDKYFDIVLTGTGKAKAIIKGGKKKKAKVETSPAKAIALPDTTLVTKGIEVIDGKKYRALTLAVTDGESCSADDFEVSGDLTGWSSGGKHVTVVLDNATTFKVRDNVPVTETRKRHIRLRR